MYYGEVYYDWVCSLSLALWNGQSILSGSKASSYREYPSKIYIRVAVSSQSPTEVFSNLAVLVICDYYDQGLHVAGD
jgi:hypothetical protein